MLRYGILALLWMAWCCVHSFLITRFVDRYLKKRLGAGYRYVRAAYNLVAIVTLVPVLAFSESLRGAPIFIWDGPLRMVQALMILAALLFFAAGARRYDFLQLAGIRQIRAENRCSVLTEDCRLDTGGILGVVRHPWYAGGILLIWARSLDPAAMVTNSVITCYFIAGAMLEERKLALTFGEAYREYQRKVSMLFPVKWIQSKWFDLNHRDRR